MVTVDLNECTHCGLCLRRFSGFCMSPSDNGEPVIDYTVCNQCQKCIAICPSQAFWMNGSPPEKITDPLNITPEQLKELMSRRRSIKQFKKEIVPREILLDIAQTAAYAPNQNKNIDIRIIDDPELLILINQRANRFVRRLYTLLFGFKPLAAFLKLFSRQLTVIQKKMAYGLNVRRHTMYENTSAVYILFGDAKVPVTEISAQYLLATMVIYAQTLGIGTCLMDSLKHTLNSDGLLKRRLCILCRKKVLGVLVAGYSGENILNKPVGYQPGIYWNDETL